jgi:hypothetical protein
MSFIIKNKLAISGALSGLLIGFLYWKFIGCAAGSCSSGSCAITSNPLNSSLYGAAFFALLFNMFKKK